MDFNLELEGKVFFDPINYTKKHQAQSSWKRVALVTFNCDLCEYYAWFIKKRYNITLNKPLRGAHLTIINDKIINESQFKKGRDLYHGQTIKLKFSCDPRTNSETWWLKVISEDATRVREACGLDPQPYFNFHITIGNANEKNILQSEYIKKLIDKFGGSYI